MLKKTVIIASMLSICVLCISKKQLSYTNEDIDIQIANIMKDYSAIGLSVVVVKNGRIVFQKAYGYNPDYSDESKRKPIKSNNLFYIASVSKTFVGTAIMQLVERGKLSLDDDVNNYLDFSVRNPNFPNVPITIRMLLCHHSSLKKDMDYDSFDKLLTKANENNKFFYNNYQPGSALSYSNLGYVILGAVIEKVSGLRFDRYINKNILRPLKLYGSYNMADLDSNRFVRTYWYNPNDAKFIKQFTTYSNNQAMMEHYVLGYSTPAFRPADGMVISSGDLAKYMIMHINKGKNGHKKRILKEKSEDTMWQKNGKTVHGFSFFHSSNLIPGNDMIGMTGGARGIHSIMFFQPEKKFGFVVICNGCAAKSADGSEMNKLIIRELYNTFVKY